MEDMRLKLSPSPSLKGVDVFVNPERRHWPVWGGTDYVNALSYEDASSTNDRESLLDIDRESAWALAPI